MYLCIAQLSSTLSITRGYSLDQVKENLFESIQILLLLPGEVTSMSK